MNELFFEERNDGLVNFSMRKIEVDGIESRNIRDYGYQFFNIKEDFWDIELRHEVDGHLDDTTAQAEVFWEAPYSPCSFSLGEMDEDAWIEDGIIKAKSEEDLF